MTNSEGMTKAECLALVAIHTQARFGAHLGVGIWLLELHWSLVVGIWDFRNSAVAGQKNAAVDEGVPRVNLTA